MTKRETLLSSVTLMSGLLLCFSLLKQRQTARDLEACQAEILIARHRADSLGAELFPVQVELNRFQIAFEILARRHPQAAEIYGTIISEETE